jgi:hypothetical protein
VGHWIAARSELTTEKRGVLVGEVAAAAAAVHL